MLKRVWGALRRAVSIYLEIDGDQRAASFAFYAFLSLFPLLLMAVSLGSAFLDAGRVTEVVLDYIEVVAPLQAEDRGRVFETIRQVMEAKGQLGLVGLLGLFWAASRFFHALVRAVNRAWHTVELEWWKVPVKSVLMLLIVAAALLVGVLSPLVVAAVESAVRWERHLLPSVLAGLRTVLPVAVLFAGFSALYTMSPRRRTRFREVWVGSLFATFGLKVLQWLLVLYNQHIWHVNVLYGALGVFVVLLLWVYLCGALIILGACLCAALADQAGNKASSSISERQ